MYSSNLIVVDVGELAPDALILYTSDHGDGLESHCLNAKGPVIYNEIARIPLLIAGPDIPKGLVNTNPVSHINIPSLRT